MAGVEEKVSIEKLDGKNWATWKFQMKHLLKSKRLWGHVEGTEVLASDATASAGQDFVEKSEKALATLVLAISTSQLYLITSCEEPHEAWKALKQHFERDTLSNKLLLKKLLLKKLKKKEKEMREGESVETHLKNMKELTDRLASIGAPIVEEDQVVTLLGSLPDSYSSLVTALEARGDGLSVDYVQQALVHECQKRSNRPGDSGGAALLGKKEPKGKKVRKCFNCGSEDHLSYDCPNLRKGKGNPGKSGKGHKGNVAQAPASGNDNDDAVVFKASAVSGNEHSTDRDSRWLVDSGASPHMTWDKTVLRNYQKLDVCEQLELGDGRALDVECPLLVFPRKDQHLARGCLRLLKAQADEAVAQYEAERRWEEQQRQHRRDEEPAAARGDRQGETSHESSDTGTLMGDVKHAIKKATDRQADRVADAVKDEVDEADQPSRTSNQGRRNQPPKVLEANKGLENEPIGPNGYEGIGSI